MNTATVVREGIEIPAAGTWEIDASHSSVGFVVRHLMVSKVRGSFGAFEGRIDIGADPTSSSVDVQIDAGSIYTGDANRDGHLRSPDFLDIDRWPHLRFRSTEVTEVDGNRFKLLGELTIRDVTRPVTLDVEYLGASADPYGNTRSAFTASTEIDREEFGITWNQALETGGVLVGRKVQIVLDVTGVKPSA